MTDERAVNTVADVALALLFVSVAVAVLSGYPFQRGVQHDPLDADRTAAVVGSSTVNVSYAVPRVPESAGSEFGADRSSSESTSSATTDGESLRITHGTIAEQVGAAAVANLTRREGDSERLTTTGERYAEALDERVKSRLVGSQFETRITAVWRPYEDAPLVGRVVVGADPPPREPVSTAVLTVPSGFEPVRQQAIDVAESGGYDAVAKTAASAIIRGYLPAQRSRYALEAGGDRRTLALSRYERMATIVDGAEPEAAVLEESLRRTHADPAAANEYLASALAGELAAEMAARYDSPSAAARALSLGEVTVAVSTWEP
jgi:hypothetical protein